ncbi:MAG: TolC family protein [Phycisphaerae bacterium]
MVRATDRDVAALIEKRQREALGYRQPAPLGDADDPLPEPDRAAYDPNPSPTTTQIPEGFEATEQRDENDARTNTAAPAPASPAQGPVGVNVGSGANGKTEEEAAGPPTRFREKVFTLTNALGYAQQYRREYQRRKEDLYLAALALTLERHLWTPQFAAGLRGVYGNFGEVTDFDQATRFVADLSVAQRLPYGGEFTAAAVSTLIRDVKRNITASEGSSIALGLDIPFLRGAGHVAQEDLIQLERSLSYAVRSFERFRRQQLVEVARQYFALLASKQAVIDAADSLKRAEEDLERAVEFQKRGKGTVLETGYAETRVLDQQNSLARGRESFRAATDRFKILIGMPVEELIGLDDLQDIQSIEQQIEEGKYPLLIQPPAADDEERAIEVATQYRLELLTGRDQIDDAKRGVAIAKNALLPDLDWTSSLTFDTDPERFNLGAFEHARATWRSEVMLSMTDRFSERNRYRASLIDVRRTQRSYTDQLERIRAEVLSAVNQIRLQEELVQIQRRKVEVAKEQSDFARDQYRKGKIDNLDLVLAEDQYVATLNRLNEAKTSRWNALLDFHLATETLRIDEEGVQHEPPALEPPPRPASDAAGTPDRSGEEAGASRNS